MGLFNNFFFDFWYISPTELIEIVLLSIVIYFFSLWLAQDKQKNLLGYFYSYCFFFFSTHMMQLHTINTLLIIMSPIVLIMFIIMHQETLQKNFITLRAITYNQQASTFDWVETLISTSLVTINSQKNFYCIIEHKDSLNETVSCPLPLHTDIQKNLFSVLLQSSIFDHTKMLWISSSGNLLGINVDWHVSYQEDWLSDSIKAQEKWIQDALFFTSKTDAIVLSITPEQKTFHIITQGKSFSNITASHALATIKKYLALDHQKGENGNVTHYEKKHFKHYQS